MTPDKTPSDMSSVDKNQTAAQAAESVPALDRDRIREIFMAHGFTVKEGQTDLKQYVYDAAEALLRAARAQAESVLEDAARLDWLDQNIFLREMDEWDKTHGGRGSDNMWVMFAPNGAQGSARKILDAARKQGAPHDPR